MTEGFTTAQAIYNFIVWCTACLFTWLGLDVEAFGILGALLLIDYVTGIWKAKRIKADITSRKMKYGIISKFSLILIPFALALAAKGVTVDAKEILFVGMNILILSELYSVIGNIYAIREGEELPEYDALAAIGKKIRSLLIKYDGGKDDN